VGIQSLDFVDGHGKLNGPVLLCYPTGYREKTWVIVRDKLEGPGTSWYRNAGIHERRFYSGGKLDGVYEVYDESGHLMSVKRYANGKLVRDEGSRTSAGAQPTP